MLEAGISSAFRPVAALVCFFAAACSGGEGKASPSVVGMSGTLTLIVQSSVGPPSDVSESSGSALVVTSPAQ
jgi:hypothetical protein